jgi:hypothetical protein
VPWAEHARDAGETTIYKIWLLKIKESHEFVDMAQPDEPYLGGASELKRRNSSLANSFSLTSELVELILSLLYFELVSRVIEQETGVLGSSDPATELARVRCSDASLIRVESLLMWFSNEMISRLGLLAGTDR